MCKMLCNIHLTRPNQIKSNQIFLQLFQERWLKRRETSTLS